jgi:hypothetical protein
MASNFPTSKDDNTSLPVESGTTPLSTNHIENHQNSRDAIKALQDKVGIDASTDQNSHDFKLSNVTGSDKAVSLTGEETMTNKTMTSPKINVGSDVAGDIYKRDGSGNFVRIPIGNANELFGVNGAGTDVQYLPVAGVTTDEKDALAGTAGTPDASNKYVTEDDVSDSGEADKVVRATGTALPALDGTSLTGLAKVADIQVFTSNGTWTKPTGAKMVFVQLWGGGGSGAQGSSGRHGGGGGGGYNEWYFEAGDLGATETVTVGAGGASGGQAGGSTTFGSLLTAYGGGAGGGSAADIAGGGGGGGPISAGGNGSGAVSDSDAKGSAGSPGLPFAGEGTSGTSGRNGMYGGGGGGSEGSNHRNGGNAFYGGGGGGAKGTTTGGTSVMGGNGSNGNGSGNSDAGQQPGGGSGGASGTSGAGGAGQARVTTFF